MKNILSRLRWRLIKVLLGKDRELVSEGMFSYAKAKFYSLGETAQGGYERAQAIGYVLSKRGDGC